MTTATSTAPRLSSPKKVLTAGAIGNIVEWFENTTYAAGVVYISANFFDPENATANIIATFGVFFISFIFRPVGGAIFGAVGDRFGRRTSLAFSLLIMGFMTTVLGLLPNFATVGALAPVLLIVVRCIQGLAIGGELGSSAVFLGEYAGPKRRATWASLTNVGGWIGTGGAIGLFWLFQSTLGEDVMMDWGWRIPFFFALPLSLFGLFIRLSLTDTPEFQELEQKGVTRKQENRLGIAFRTAKKQMFVVFLVSATNSAFTFFVASYVLTYLRTTVGVDPGVALLTNTIAVTLGFIPAILWGIFTDKVGRKTTLIIAYVVFIVLTIPLMLMMDSGSTLLILIAQILFVACVPLISAPLMALCVEMFDPEIRSSAAAFTTGLGGGIFGGGIGFVSSSLVASTGNALSPAFFLMGLALVVLIVVLTMLKETLPSKTGEV